MFQFFRSRKVVQPTSPAPAPTPAKTTMPPEGVTLEIAETATFKSKLIVEGEGHVITIGAGSRVRGSIRLKGRNHRITIGQDVDLNDQIDVRGRDNRMTIGDKVALGGRLVITGNGQSIDIGNGTVARDTYVLCHEEQYVRIGRGCLFSRNVEIRTTDAHALICRETGERLNRAQPIEIGDHVWMGVGVLVSKGAKIADDNVVGAKSFVAKPFLESGTVIAGVPAKVVKRGVTWQRDTKEKYDPDKLDGWRALAMPFSLYLSSGLFPFVV
jgi:acetyltransferase-like isoleucine patch superfamily enzyme